MQCNICNKEVGMEIDRVNLICRECSNIENIDEIGCKIKMPILGKGEYVLIISVEEKTQMKGLAIIEAKKYGLNKQEPNTRQDITSIKQYDNDDFVIWFENVKGVDALISELKLLKKVAFIKANQ